MSNCLLSELYKIVFWLYREAKKKKTKKEKNKKMEETAGEKFVVTEM